MLTRVHDDGEETPQGLRRQALSGARDVRAVRTRQRLVRALEAVVRDGGTAGASVAVVTRRAGVSPSAFYTHFAGMDDLAVYALEQVFDQVSPLDLARRREHTTSRAQVTRQGLVELLDGLSAQEPLLALVQGSSARVQDRLVREMARTLTTTLAAERPDLSPGTLQLSAEFIAAGVLRLLLRWLAGDLDVDREELMATIQQLLPTYLTDG